MALRELAHKAVHSTQKIVYIRLCLYIIQVHEQFVNHCELSGNFFAKYHMHDKAALFETITKCVDYASVLIFKCLD